MFTSKHDHLEAAVMFHVCTFMRERFKEEYREHPSAILIFNKVMEFYEIVAPKMAETLRGVPHIHKLGHAVAVMESPISVFLGPDDRVDYGKLREYLVKTWPDADIESVMNPNSGLPQYVDRYGKSVVSKPGVLAVGKSAAILLEKAGLGKGEWIDISNLGRAHPDQTIDIDLSKPITEPYVLDNQEADIEVKTEHGVPITFASIQAVTAELEKMPDDIKHALYRYWYQITRRDIPIQLEWTHFGTFAVWAVRNGYELGHRLKKADDELGYVAENVTWVPVEEMRK